MNDLRLSAVTLAARTPPEAVWDYEAGHVCTVSGFAGRLEYRSHQDGPPTIDLVRENGERFTGLSAAELHALIDLCHEGSDRALYEAAGCLFPCPLCNGASVCWTVGKNNWAVCDRCRVRWWGGHGLVSGPEEQTEEYLAEAESTLRRYAPVAYG